MAPAEGVEPPAFAFEARRSIQLSYAGAVSGDAVPGRAWLPRIVSPDRPKPDKMFWRARDAVSVSRMRLKVFSRIRQTAGSAVRADARGASRLFQMLLPGVGLRIFERDLQPASLHLHQAGRRDGSYPVATRQARLADIFALSALL